jgi:ubiquinone/menaquinone biosynthesis C-methylase UbiE
MPQTETARAGYFKGDLMELNLRYAYRPEYIPLLLDYLGAGTGSRILEVGCGSGFLARLLARSLEQVEVIGLDTDLDLLELAEQMVTREGLDERIILLQGEAGRLPFPDGSFDLVTSQRVL